MIIEKIKSLFIPHAGNGFRPNFLERFSMLLMLVLVVLTFAIANLQALLWIGSEWMVSTILPAVIVTLTNEERSDGSLQELVRSETLDRAAQLKAEDMAKNGYFSHDSPEGVTPWHWFDVAGYDYLHAGENLAVHFTDSSKVVDGWMKSPTHRANILNGEYQEIGVGTANGVYKGSPTVFVVQLFGTRRAVGTGAPSLRDGAPVPSDTTSHVSVSNPAEPHVLAESITVSTNDAEVVTPEPTTEDASQVNEVVRTNQQVEYLNLATTSREGVPAIIDAEHMPPSPPTEPNALARSATQPSVFIQTIYGILALIIVLALIASIAIEWRRQHPVQIAYAGGLLAIMACLLYIHTLLTSGVSII